MYNKVNIYDYTRKETLERAEAWFKWLNEGIKTNHPRIILVGNIIDLT